MTEPTCEHTKPTYAGYCEKCGERIESPSRAMRDYAERTGGTIVHMTKTIRLPEGVTPETLIAHLTPRIAEARKNLARQILSHLHGKTID